MLSRAQGRRGQSGGGTFTDAVVAAREQVQPRARCGRSGVRRCCCSTCAASSRASKTSNASGAGRRAPPRSCCSSGSIGLRVTTARRAKRAAAHARRSGPGSRPDSDLRRMSSLGRRARARSRASDLMRSTIERKPFERCGVRCSRSAELLEQRDRIGVEDLRAPACPNRARTGSRSARARYARRCRRRTRASGPPRRSALTCVPSQTWLAQPCTLLASVRSCLGQRRRACARARSHSDSGRPSRRGRRNSR